MYLDSCCYMWEYKVNVEVAVALHATTKVYNGNSSIIEAQNWSMYDCNFKSIVVIVML